MGETTTMPAPARHLAGFSPFLRGFGFNTSPEQTVAFLAAVELLGPRGIGDVRRAAVATFAPPRERSEEFGALFRAWFYGEVTPVPVEGEDEIIVIVTDTAVPFSHTCACCIWSTKHAACAILINSSAHMAIVIRCVHHFLCLLMNTGIVHHM